MCPSPPTPPPGASDAQDRAGLTTPVTSGSEAPRHLEVLEELRRLARSKLLRLPPGQTLQPTALVNEVYLRLIERGAEAPGREEYLLRAARVMQDVLVEHARHKASLRAGGAWRRAHIDELSLVADAPPALLLALHTALERLSHAEPRKAELVRLRFFVGLDEEQCAEVLGISKRTARRDWRFVRSWLFTELQDASHGDLP